MRPQSLRRAFTLAEVMVSFAIMMPLAVLTVALMLSSVKQFTLGDQQNTSGASARLLLSRFSRDAIGCQAFQVFDNFTTRTSRTGAKGAMIVLAYTRNPQNDDGDGLAAPADAVADLRSPRIHKVVCYYLDLPPGVDKTGTADGTIPLRRLSSEDPQGLDWPVEFPAAITDNTKLSDLIPAGNAARAAGREIARLDISQLGKIQASAETSPALPFTNMGSTISATLLLRAGQDATCTITPVQITIPTYR